MKINEKDRGQLLRMAGNIACGMIERSEDWEVEDWIRRDIASQSARLALFTLQEVDKLIEAELAKEE